MKIAGYLFGLWTVWIGGLLLWAMIIGLTGCGEPKFLCARQHCVDGKRIMWFKRMPIFVDNKECTCAEYKLNPAYKGDK